MVLFCSVLREWRVRCYSTVLAAMCCYITSVAEVLGCQTVTAMCDGCGELVAGLGSGER